MANTPTASLHTHRVLIPILALASIIILTSCGPKRISVDFESPYTPLRPVLEEGNLEELRTVLEERYPAVSTMKTTGRIVIEQAEVAGKIWFESDLFYQDPAHFLLRGRRTPIGEIFRVATDSRSACIFLTRDREVFAGSLLELQQLGGLSGSMAPDELAAAVLVHQNLSQRLDAEEGWSLSRNREELIVTLREPDRRRIEWRLRRSDGLAERVTHLSPAGLEEIQIQYRAYEFFEGVPYPTEFRIFIAESETTIEVRLNSYIIDPTLSPQVFDCPSGPRIREYLLREIVTRQVIAPDEDGPTLE